MHRFRKKSETKRSQAINVLFEPLTPPSSTTSQFEPPPALPALSTGVEFRTSVIFPDLTRQFAAVGRPANVSEGKIRSRLAQQRAHGIEDTITEEEEELMFAALNSIQGIRRRGNSTSSITDVSVDVQYPESASSTKSSSGPSSSSLINAFPETPAVQDTSIYPLASLNSGIPPTASSKRHSNNMFGSSKFRDASHIRAGQRNRTVSSSTNSQDSMQGVAISSDNEYGSDLSDLPEESVAMASTSSAGEAIGGSAQLSDKEKTPVVRTSRLPSAPRLPNGNTLTVAQIRRMSKALERAISAIVENEHEADDDDEKILAPHSVPLGGGYPSRRPPTAFNDPSNPIEVSDLNAVLMFLAEAEHARLSQNFVQPENSVVAPAPVARTPGYVPGMTRPISPRDASGHDSEDYSTTPRATSPVYSLARGISQRRQGNSRPSTGQSRTNVSLLTERIQQENAANTARAESPYTNGQQYERRAPIINTSNIASGPGRRGPSSPSSQENSRFEMNSHSVNSGHAPSNAATSLSRSQSDATYRNTRSDINQGSTHKYTLTQEQQDFAEITKGLQREKLVSRAVAGPTLPDSPLVDEDPFKQSTSTSSDQSWNGGGNNASDIQAPIAMAMPQPTPHRLQKLGGPNVPRPQTPNNIVRSSTPVAMRSITPPTGRVSTPNYLVQRSPTANGFNTDNDDGVVRRTISPRPTLSHTPSTSSASGFNQLLHTSLGNSSRSSIGSAGSSYHSSSDETSPSYREISKWLFDPESKGSTYKSNGKKSSRQRPENTDNPKDDSDGKEDESIGDHEDVLELLTGLTKKDLAGIQQKLVSAAVAREAEEAIRHSQRRRRPSVQSRDFGSPTPKPIVNQQQEPATTIVAQTQPVVNATAVLQKQASTIAPEVKSEPPAVIVQTTSALPMIVTRPISPIGELLPQVDESKEFEVPSAATTPPLLEPELVAEPSPRARALAEALFGKDQTTPGVTPGASPVRPHKPSTEDLRDEVEKKAMAATVALKNPSLYVEGSSPLRRKSTKRIDLQKISGPHLVSASMSVDAIPLASPSMASLGSPEASKGGSKLGDRLRRLGGSLRSKSKPVPNHSKESSTASTVIYEHASGEQVVSYDPNALHQPQIRSGPAQTGIDPATAAAAAAAKSPAVSVTIASPPASAGPAGLKGFMAKLRTPRHAARSSKDFGNPTRPAVSMQPSASLSSSQLHEPAFTPLAAPASLAPPIQSAQASVTSSPAQTPDEIALEQLFAAAHNLGLNPADLSELLAKSGSQTAKLAAVNSRPGTGNRRYEDSSGMAWTNDQPSTTPSRQPSIRMKSDGAPRARPAREGNNPVSGVVRRTIIYPSTAAPTSASPLPGQSRSASVHQKTASSIYSKRRPMSMQSQVSGRSVIGRIPTPPPSRGAARRLSQDGHAPPVPSSLYSASNGRPGTSAGIISSYMSRRSSDTPDVSDQPAVEEGRALQLLELENGDVIWSVLDTLRDYEGEDPDEDPRFTFVQSRASFSSQVSTPEEAQSGISRVLGRSTSRAGAKGSMDAARSETKVFYGDAREIAHLIGQISQAADPGSFAHGAGTPASMRSSEDLPVEEQLDRLLHRVAEAR